MARVLDLFAGGGGFSLGFRQAGLGVARAVENFKPKAETYRANFPEVELWERDIQTVAMRESFDVVIGGPPCEPYTPANGRRREFPLDRLYKDKIGSLVLQFIRLVGETRPRVFVMENVVQVAEGPLRAELVRHFREQGYPTLHFNELNAVDAGCPSRRVRLFISNIPLKLRPGAPPPSVGQVLAGLPPPGPGPIANHEPHPLSAEKRRRLERLDSRESVYRYTAATGRSHENWLRLDARLFSPPVLGSSRFVHPSEPRLLTPREHARLLGFPDDFVLKGGRDKQYDAVGEAVPPPLARAIATQVAAHLAAHEGPN